MCCYLIAKDEDAHGCFALKTYHGPRLAKLVSELDGPAGENGIEIVTLSRPTAYGEYEPYTFVEDEAEFVSCVMNMLKEKKRS